jgi:RNA polymerase sigma-70 factor (ECF subfamily)
MFAASRPKLVSTPAPVPEAEQANSQFTSLVERIRAGDDDAMEELYRLFSRGIRFYLCRQLQSQEIDDKIHDTFLIVVQAIRRGELRDPERLMGFVRTIVRRQVAAYIGEAVQTRKEHVDLEAGSSVLDGRCNPEQTAMDRQSTDIMRGVLQSISDRDREILTRFYLLEHSQERICREMNLTETQFRLLKSRAKARFGELGKRRVERTPLSSLFLRRKGVAGH